MRETNEDESNFDRENHSTKYSDSNHFNSCMEDEYGISRNGFQEFN